MYILNIVCGKKNGLVLDSEFLRSQAPLDLYNVASLVV